METLPPEIVSIIAVDLLAARTIARTCSHFHTIIAAQWHRRKHAMVVAGPRGEYVFEFLTDPYMIIRDRLTDYDTYVDESRDTYGCCSGHIVQVPHINIDGALAHVTAVGFAQTHARDRFVIFDRESIDYFAASGLFAGIYTARRIETPALQPPDAGAIYVYLDSHGDISASPDLCRIELAEFVPK